jgi:hypothetical protein
MAVAIGDVETARQLLQDNPALAEELEGKIREKLKEAQGV